MRTAKQLTSWHVDLRALRVGRPEVVQRHLAVAIEAVLILRVVAPAAQDSSRDGRCGACMVGRTVAAAAKHERGQLPRAYCLHGANVRCDREIVHAAWVAIQRICAALQHNCVGLVCLSTRPAAQT